MPKNRLLQCSSIVTAVVKVSIAVQVQMYQLSRLLHDHHKDLYDHFEMNEIAPTLYAAPWFLTIFASQFPVGFVARVFGMSRNCCLCWFLFVWFITWFVPSRENMLLKIFQFFEMLVWPGLFVENWASWTGRTTWMVSLWWNVIIMISVSGRVSSVIVSISNINCAEACF